eukprot:UN04221
MGDYYYVVLDDCYYVTEVDVATGEFTKFVNNDDPTECEGSDHEAVFQFPTMDGTLVVCGEDKMECNRITLSHADNTYTREILVLTDGGDGCHNEVDFTDNNGLEGAFGVMDSDDNIYMFALIEAPGKVITYKLDEENSQWVT